MLGTMQFVSIRELQRQVTERPEPFEFHAQVESLLSKTTKGGKPFYELKLTDAEDQITIRVWEDSQLFPQVEGLGKGGFVSVAGEWFRNEPYGIEPRSATVRPLSPEQVKSLLEGSDSLRERQARDYAEIQRIVGEIADPRLRGLSLAFLTQFGERFKRTGAARNFHHARRGGLVEHIAQMMRSTLAVCSAYPTLNRDLIVAGVLFHDCGKLWENAYAENDFTMPYTDVGELLSHIPLGMEIVNKLWRDLMESPEAAGWKDAQPPSDQVRLHLLHLIASHHGEHQFGAPVLPKTPEAMALHYIDNLDAKLEMFSEGYETAPQLSKNVFDRVRPLPSRMVRPLPRFGGGASEGNDPF